MDNFVVSRIVYQSFTYKTFSSFQEGKTDFSINNQTQQFEKSRVTMWWASLKWVVLVVTFAMLGSNADPSPRNEDMFRELMKLDQLYSSIARPR